MATKVDNAVIMAAGLSSRFIQSPGQKPKALTVVKGEVLIERQIRQLLAAGVPDIYVVIGHMAESFHYLADLFPIQLVLNEDYLTRNNNGSIYVVRDVLRNSYICSADNYFVENPFEREVAGSYYAAVYANGETEEWCLTFDENEIIRDVTIGGRDSWYMMGHAYWDEAFSRRFLEILLRDYAKEATRPLLWEAIYKQNLATLTMRIRKYPPKMIYEFDTLEELRAFDPV